MGSGDWTHLDKSDPPVYPGLDYSEYDDAFLSAERRMKQQLAAGDPPPAGLTPDDLRARIEAMRADSQKPDAATSGRSRSCHGREWHRGGCV